ncbi:Mmp37-domain-containing protein [Cladochytrium replicatum]|nr:Mmp37-domain-containing protein [Cladochytrium replicatum]
MPLPISQVTSVALFSSHGLIPATACLGAVRYLQTQTTTSPTSQPNPLHAFPRTQQQQQQQHQPPHPSQPLRALKPRQTARTSPLPRPTMARFSPTAAAAPSVAAALERAAELEEIQEEAVEERVEEELEERLHAVLGTFNAPVRFAFAYGSGVFPQAGYSAKKRPMVDFVFGVTHPGHWHSLNMRQNREHYSFLAGLGSDAVSFVQNKVPAHVYYNPYVEIKGMLIKYGVISMDTLLDDLSNWKSLYMAGRMHKPVKILRDDARVQLASRDNLNNALRAALCLLPAEFTEEDLFHRIAGLSYRGDFRMILGENPHKIYNMVFSQQEQFRELYAPLIEQMPNVSYVREGEFLQQDMDPRMRGAMIQAMPKGFVETLRRRHQWYLARSNFMHGHGVIEDSKVAQSIASSPQLPQYVSKALVETVRAPALVQSIKGLVTAGPLRSAVYVSEKLKKQFKASSSATRSDDKEAQP